MDSARSWFVCAGCAILICGASVGFRCSGILLVAISDEFNVPRGIAAWPSSILNVMTFLAGIIVGPIVQKYPLRPVLIFSVFCNGLGFILGAAAPNVPLLTVTYGALHGFGCGCILVTTSILLSQYFDRRRGTAFGIANAASPIASIIFPALLKVLLEYFGFKGAMLTLGVILISLTPVSFALKDAPWTLSKAQTDNQNMGDSAAKLFQWDIFHMPMFYVILCANVVFQWTFDTFLATIVDYGKQMGLSLQDGVIILACYSVADLIGRLFLPSLADCGLLGRDTLLASSYLLSCTLMFLLCISRNLISLAGVIICLGPFLGLSGTYYNSVVARYLGMERLGFAYGVIGLFSAIPFFLMPFGLGFFRDILGDYRWMYITNATLLFTASLPWIGVIILRKMGRYLGTPPAEQQ